MGQVWFGTKEYMQWVADPTVDVSAGKVGFATQMNFLSGGVWVRTSKAAARKFSFSWGTKKRERVQPILDYADGMYGPGPFYYVNPFAMNTNMLPAYWAAPYINAYDGPLLVDGNRPTITTGTVTNGYPYESATYTLTTTSVVPSVFIPIPPGHTAHVGVHGANLTGTNAVTVREHTGASVGAPINMTFLAKTANPTNWTSAGTTTGITISMRSTANGTMRLDGLVVQVLPSGSVSPVGGFISGQGTAGLSFVSQPSVSEYSAALGMIGVSAEMIETEPWT